MTARILSIAGLDPSAGAGITADVRVVQVLGGEAAAVPTCLTVQNRRRFERVESVDAAWLRDALQAAVDDAPLGAIKVGMLPDVDILRVVAALVEAMADVPVVVDPVLSATAGGFDPGSALAVALRDELLPLVTVATPNGAEAEALGGPDLVRSRCALLVTGGDAEGGLVVDRLYDAERVVEIEHPRIARRAPVHGTGCALSTAVAFYLAGGADLEIACRAGVEDVRRFIGETPDDAGAVPVALRIVSEGG